MLIFLILTITPLLLMIFGIINLKKVQNSKNNISWLEVLWFIPMLVLMYFAGTIFSEILFGDTGNGSRMAVLGIVYFILITFAALYGYLTTLTTSPKGKVYRILLIIAMPLLFVPIFVFSAYLFGSIQLELLKDFLKELW